MITAKLLVLPKLSSIDDFEELLHETEIWQCLTDLERKGKDQSVDDNIRQTCSDIKVKDLNSDDSVDTLMNKLRILFAKNIIWLCL